MKRNNQIGSFSNQWFSGNYTNAFNEWMNDGVVFWFIYCIYDLQEIADKFENSQTILKKREHQMHWIDEIANDSGYSVNTIIQKIKNGMVHQWSNLSTIEIVKYHIENGFTGFENEWIKDRALEFCNDYYDHRDLETIEYLSIKIREGSPNIYQGREEIRPIIYDPGYDPNALTPAEIEAARLAEIERLRLEALKNTSNAGFGGMALNIALGGMILYTLFTRKKK
ncbi:MAG: hypothetical protein WCJ61_12565 [Paludibacter sp.]